MSRKERKRRSRSRPSRSQLRSPKHHKRTHSRSLTPKGSDPPPKTSDVPKDSDVTKNSDVPKDSDVTKNSDVPKDRDVPKDSDVTRNNGDTLQHDAEDGSQEEEKDESEVLCLICGQLGHRESSCDHLT